jgi:hypothetical protein
MSRKFWQKLILVAIAGAVLAPAAQAAGLISGKLKGRGNVKPTVTTNTAPTISGTPSTSLEATQSYSFTPTAVDAQNNALTFSIANKPVWASFSAATGNLSGTAGGALAGTYSSIVITVSDGALRASLPAFSITVHGTTNTAPVISGTPATTVLAGNTYAFSPNASDADGNALGFSVANKPSWAAFSTATGALTGSVTAQQVGTYPNIVITVSDGSAARSLPAYSISVTQPAVVGTASLTWTAPTQNTDGSALIDLAGYKVYHGTSASALNEIFDVPGAASTTYAFNQLATGTHYFAVAAYSHSGVQSSISTVGSKLIQ